MHLALIALACFVPEVSARRLSSALSSQHDLEHDRGEALRQQESEKQAGSKDAFVPGVKQYYTFPPAPNALIVDICMREKGITTDAIVAHEKWINLPSSENRNADCLQMNPEGTVPWFVMDDGSVVAETMAMCEYIEEVLPDPPLIGSTPQKRATVRQWQRRMEEHYVHPAFYGHRFWTASSDCPDDHFMKNFFAERLNEQSGAHLIPQASKGLRQWARNRILWLEQVKQRQPSFFIAGDAFSVVDVQVYIALWFFSEEFPHPPQPILQDLQGRVPWVQSWYDMVGNRSSIVAAREYRELDMNNRPTAQSKPP